MATAAELNMGWFRYTCDDGTFRALKTDALWGANAASGFTAFNAADAPFPSRAKRNRPRKIVLQSNATGRTTTLPVATTAATAWTNTATTVSRFVRGLQTAIVFTRVAAIAEKITRPRAIIAKAQDTAAT
jgi:hypothetical protein